MRIPEPKKLPSGKWYVQIMVDGKRSNKTFHTKEEAAYWAAGLKTKAIEDNRDPTSLTLTAAVDRYIESKSSILSPSTIKGYRTLQSMLGDIEKTNLNDLTQEKVQRWLNKLSK